MNKAQILDLAKLSGSTLEQIQKASPELAREMNAVVATDRQANVLSAFQGSSTELVEAIRKIDFSPATQGTRSTADIILAGLSDQKIGGDLAKEAANRFVELQRQGILNDVADGATTIAEHPLFQSELQTAKVYHLAATASLDDEKTDALAKAAADPLGLQDDTLTALVGQASLTADDASRLGITSSLFQLTSEDDSLTSQTAPRLKSIEDITTLSVDDWQSSLKKAQITPPDGLDTSTYAEALRRAATNLFPTAALFANKTTPDAGSLTPAFEVLQRLKANNANVLDVPFDQLNVDGLKPEEVEAAKAAQQRLSTLARQNPGLRLEELISTTDGAEKQAAAASSRLGIMQKVMSQNPDTEFMGLDYTQGSADIAALKMDGISTDDQKLVLNNLKATQRVYSIARDTDLTEKLMSAGFSSSVSIVSSKLDDFQKAAGLTVDQAKQIYDKATTTTMQVSNIAAALIDAHKNIFNRLNVGNSQPGVQDYLKSIPGFSELFGNQNYCKCDECQSIIGAAAYFVDLMHFIETNVTKVVFTGSKAQDTLAPKVRRPDLWTLTLTCDHTNTLVPYLDIINQTLENYIAKKQSFAGSYTDRSEVEGAVYHQALSTHTDSFKQPFTLPLTKLDIYLEHFSVSRYDIASAISTDVPTLQTAAFKISNTELSLLLNANVTTAWLNRIYGISFSFTGSTVNPLDVQLLLPPTGLSRADFGAVVASRFVANAGANTLQIVAEKTSADSVQNDIERIHGLTADALDRIHRFVRLQRLTPWSFVELDLLITQMSLAGINTDMNECLNRLTQIMQLHTRFGLPVDQTAALWGPIPLIALSSSQQSLFDRLFNFTPFVSLDGPLPKPAVSFIHSSFRAAGTPLPADNTTHRLLAGLQLLDSELAALIRALAAPLGVNLGTANESDRGFLLTAGNLDLLYRHAQISRLLGITVSQLFQMISLFGIGSGYVNNLDALLAVFKAYDWLATSGYTLDQFGYSTHSVVLNPTSFPSSSSVASTIVANVKRDDAMSFAPSVFAFMEGVTEQQSQAILAANPTLTEPVPNSTGGMLRLTAQFQAGVAINIPAGVTVTSSAVLDVLSKYHPARILPSALTAQLGMSADRVPILLSMTGADLYSAAMLDSLRGGSIAPLEALTGRMAVLSVVFSPEGFDAKGLAYLQQNPAIFGITDFNSLNAQQIFSLSLYAQAAATIQKATPSQQTAQIQTALQDSLSAFAATTHFDTADKTKLATALLMDEASLATLLPNVPLPATAMEAFAALAKAATLARTVGVGGDTLRLIVDPAYERQAQAADAVLSAFRAQYTVDQDFLDQLEPYDDRIRSRRRDGLTDYLLHSLSLPFTSLTDLYNYFLLDVQLEGCARTSWVVAAISSAQLYVYRCLMNLEQDQRAVTDPLHIHVSPTLIPADEWEWRKNFRVWQANRKVFLYPENYLEPTLRDDKTPLFKDLESNLLQQPINEQNVLDAYSTYLSGFDDLSRLRIAGSYQDFDAASRTDILHLFGVTPGDPPTYYYRTIQNAIYGETQRDRNITYSPWQQINVQIPGRDIAPVVYLGRLFVFWTEVTTTPVNQVSDGGSQFSGYKHHLSIKFTSLRLDGTWTAPQPVSLASNTVFPSGDGIVQDPLADAAELQAYAHDLSSFNFSDLAEDVQALSTPRYDTRVHTEPIDGYTLDGFQWDRVYPTSGSSTLKLTARNFVLRSNVDFYRKSVQVLSRYVAASISGPILCSRTEAGGIRRLYFGQQSTRMLERYPWYSIASSDSNIQKLRLTAETSTLANYFNTGLYKTLLATIRPSTDIAVINNSERDAILDVDGDMLLLQSSVRSSGYLLRRLSTTLGERLSRILFISGVDGLLQLDTQTTLGESTAPLTLSGTTIKNSVVSGKMDFRGAMGTYFREIFFHVPFLIASQLNSQQNFEAAQRWYNYIFDPTADDPVNIPSTATAAQREKMERDRVWRYIEFKNLDVPKLREILSDPAAIEAYKKDPFNPHAIARLRLSAYQKCIVMRYIDNLLDWADNLFSQFQMETVNEATLLYVLAQEILGPRPADIGSCGQTAESTWTYEKIGPLLKANSDFLVEVETSTIVVDTPGKVPPKKRKDLVYTLPPDLVKAHLAEAIHLYQPLETIKKNTVVNAHTSLVSNSLAAPVVRIARAATNAATTAAAANESITYTTTAAADAEIGIAQQFAWKKTYVASWLKSKSATVNVRGNVSPSKGLVGRSPKFGISVIRQFTPVFCIPENDNLLEYWKRVEDRLYKIRHCQDINGVKRQLSLFAPPIDPMLLVEATAAGLSIDDVLSSVSGDLPPYRFTYLVEKARQYAAVAQGFGTALLSAIERRDAEQLSRLHQTQQQNILAMTTKLRQQDIDHAQNTIDTLTAQQATAQYRHDYYQGLVDGGLNAAETTQAVSRHSATALYITSSLLSGTGGVLNLIPQLGSPFAMKYGGAELGSSAAQWANVLRDTGKIAEIVAASAGLEAGFDRREEGWRHQVDLASKELDQIAKQLKGANILLRSAQQNYSIHQKTIQQAQDVWDFYQNRFSNLGLYTWLATSMQRIYRDAYNNAFHMAKLAEQAYRFERNDNTTELLSDNYWGSAQNGLLAGESLIAGINELERKFIETNYRALEVDQSFSLAQIAPAALLALRETGTCDFSIPELAYDLFYPGQYSRQIKAVRLTIPTVTGPFVNVSATLTLTGSKLRLKPQLTAAAIVDVPVRRSVSIATSTGQSDSGVFEFSFRDERYMPFEGAGAVSSWNLMLPQTFRQFDYDTIPDVVVHVSYTAQQDGVLRQSVETTNAAIQGSLINTLKNQSSGRLFSLKQEFSSVFHRLLHSAANTPIKFTLLDKHLPIYLRNRSLVITRAALVLRTDAAQTVSGASFTLDGTTVSTFNRDTTLSNLWSADVLPVFTAGLLGDHTFTVNAAGDLSLTAPTAGDVSAIDEKKLGDVFLYLEYCLQ